MNLIKNDISEYSAELNKHRNIQQETTLIYNMLKKSELLKDPNLLVFDSLLGRKLLPNASLYHENKNYTNLTSIIYVDDMCLFGKKILDKMFFLDKMYLEKFCKSKMRLDVLPVLSFEIYFYQVSYFAFLEFLDYTNYLKDKYDDCVSLEIVLCFDDIYYNPLPFYFYKYNYLLGKVNRKELFENVKSNQDIGDKHKKTIQIFESVNKNKFLMEMENIL